MSSSAVDKVVDKVVDGVRKKKIFTNFTWYYTSVIMPFHERDEWYLYEEKVEDKNVHICL